MVKLNLMSIFLLAFLLFSIGDLVTTIMIAIKHPVFNETAPLFLAGVPLWALVAVKVIIVIYLFYFCHKKYQTIRYPFMRYVLVYYIVFAAILNLAVVINNIHYYNIPSEEIVPISDEVKLQFYKEAIGELKVMKNLTPTREQEIPIIFMFGFINMLQFLVFQSFEKHKMGFKYAREPSLAIEIK